MERVAWAVLRDLGQKRPPVDIRFVCSQYAAVCGYFQAAELLDVPVALLSGQYRLLDGFTLYRSGERPLVLYNDALSVQRVRFTIAHEAAHLILRHRFCSPGLLLDAACEREADVLAAALLMPVPLLLSHKRSGLPMTSGEVAQAFCVSKTAAKRRLAELESMLFPVVSEESQVSQF